MRRVLGYLRGQEILALRARYAGPIAFVCARLSPTGYLGLQLTVGALVLIAFSWLFGGIAEDVVTGDALTLVDLQVAAWFGSHVTRPLAGAMLMVSGLHGPASMSVLVGLTAAVLAWKRSWSWLMVLALSSPGGMLVNVLMKLVFQRARPVSDHPLQVLMSYSFPSGHVAGATLAVHAHHHPAEGHHRHNRDGAKHRHVLAAPVAIA